MNIKDFLSSGTTYVHTKELGGNFTKSAVAIVLGFAIGASAVMGAGLIASSMTGRASSVSEMQYPDDSVSQLYQALVSPEENSSIRVVSTKSAFLSSVLDSMPLALAKNSKEAGESISSYYSDPVAVSLLVKGGAFKKRESICIVNAVETVDELVSQKDGVEYINIAVSGRGTEDEFAVIGGNLSPKEAKLIITLHELSHCQTRFASERSLSASGDIIQAEFEKAFDEAGADLAVILYYASKEGTFENGSLAINALRGQFNNGGHSTTAIIEKILDELDPNDFVGMGTPDIFKAATEIMDDALDDKAFTGKLKSAFLSDYYERGMLSAMVTGNTLQLDEMRGGVLDSFKQAAPDFTYDTQTKASQMLDRALDHGLRNPDLHRGLGNISVQGIEALAVKMGVALTGDQLLKARFLDAEFTPVGHKGDVGVAMPSGLKEVNYFAELEAKASLTQNKGSGLRM